MKEVIGFLLALAVGLNIVAATFYFWIRILP